MKTTCIVLAALIFVGALPGKDKGKGKGKHAGHSGDTAGVAVIFSDGDRHAIQQWTRGRPQQGLPPGLAKRGELPPGLQKHLQRNGTLPPGLQKKLSPFPRDLAVRLAPLPPDCGCRRVFLEGKAMIVVGSTGVVLDLMDVF